jgi:hypothetical protein
MSIAKVFYGIALLPLLAGVAMAEPNLPAPAVVPQISQTAPMPSQTGPAMSQAAPTKHKPKVLADEQMDTVTAGLLITLWGDGTATIKPETVVEAVIISCAQHGGGCHF